MNGDRLTLGLMAFYLILAGVFAYERQFAKAQYWLGAFLITSAIWRMN